MLFAETWISGKEGVLCDCKNGLDRDTIARVSWVEVRGLLEISWICILRWHCSVPVTYCFCVWALQSREVIILFCGSMGVILRLFHLSLLWVENPTSRIVPCLDEFTTSKFLYSTYQKIYCFKWYYCWSHIRKPLLPAC